MEFGFFFFVYLKIEDKDGGDAGQQYGAGCGESLEDVVSVLYDRCHQQTAQRLESHH
jgi:hypothetical protein